MEKYLAQFKSYFNRNRSGVITWSLTFLLIVTFLAPFTTNTISEAQYSVNPNSAGKVYLRDYTPNLTDSLNELILGAPPNTGNGNVTGQNTGAIVELASLTQEFYDNPPTSGIVWAQGEYDKIQGLDEFTVQAQSDPGDSFTYYPGLGYTVLRPVSTLWQWSRNLSYFFFIIILVILSFLILFRQSLGGQTLVTITNSIPSLIWAIALVSLSYPITGFFVDVITIGTNFAQSVMITAPGAPGAELINSNYLEQTNPDINYLQPNDPELSIWSIWYTSNSEVCEADDCRVSNILPDVGQENPFLTFVGIIIQGAEDTSSSTQSAIANPLLNLVIAIAAFAASFKLFMALLKNYVMIIIYAIISPFIFIGVAIPGRTYSTMWNFLRTLFAASLTFVAVYALFLLMVIIGQSENFGDDNFGQIRDLSYAPPLLGYTNDQIVGSNSIVRTLIIYFLFIFSPSIPEIVKNFLQVQPTGQYLSQVGQDTASAGRKLVSGARGVGKYLGIGGGGG